MSVCCMFLLIFVNESMAMLTADIALLPTGAFKTFANLKRNYEYFTTFRKSTHICTSLQVKVLPKKCTSLLKKSKLFYLSKVTK